MTKLWGISEQLETFELFWIAFGGPQYKDATAALRARLRTPNDELRACPLDFVQRQVELQIRAWFDVLRSEPSSAIARRFECSIPSITGPAELIACLCNDAQFDTMTLNIYREERVSLGHHQGSGSILPGGAQPGVGLVGGGARGGGQHGRGRRRGRSRRGWGRRRIPTEKRGLLLVPGDLLQGEKG